MPRRPPALDAEATPDHAELRAVDPQDYAIGPEMARGGMGRILVARDRRHGRPVAIKELLQLDRDHRRRFQREAMTTARLQHPSIVNIYEAGEWPSGEPFYAMKLVKGRSLQRVLGEARTFEERMALLPSVLAVADALAYAHGHEVIHRDLKPDNVLLGEFGETVVIDWGLAKDLSAPRDDPSATPTAQNVLLQGAGLTQEGDIVGTPTNMPPEQARGLAVDARADVYALGSILYEVLAGRPAYRGTNAMHVLIQVVQGPPPAVQEVEPRVPADLAAIVGKAMAREPAARYPTAKELAEELRRFQTGQLVAAHTYRPAELLRRWIRRHRTALTLAGVFAAVLAAVGATSLVQIVKARRVAEAAQARAEAERDRAEEATRREAARADELALAQARVELGRDPVAALGLLRGLSPSFARWGAARLVAAEAAASGVPAVLEGHQGTVTDIAFSPDGAAFATAGKDRAVRLWDVRTREHRLVARHDHWAWFAAFSRDGGAVASAGRDMALRISGLDGAVRQVLRHPAMVWHGAFAPDGRTIASACFDGNVRLWDLSTGEATVLTGHRDRVQHVVFSADGRLLASASDDATIRVWDVRSREHRVLTGHGAPVWRVRFHPSGASLASADQGGKALLWELASGRSREIATHEGGVRDLTFSADGGRLATCGRDGLVRVLAMEPEPKEERVLRGHGDAVRHLAFSPDGKLLASGSLDNTVRLWDLESGESRVLRGYDAWAPPVFAPDGSHLLLAAPDGTLRLHDVDLGARVFRTGGELRGLAVGGRRIAASGAAGLIWLWDLDAVDAEAARPFSWRDPGLAAVVLGADGARLAAAGETLRLWELDGDVEPVVAATGPFTSAAFAPDGLRVLAGAADGRIVIATMGPTVDVRTQATGTAARIPALAASRADVAWGADDGTAGFFGASGPPRALSSHLDLVTALRFSSDGAWLATASHDTTACLSRTDGRADVALRAHDAAVWSLAFGPGWLATGSGDRTVAIWDLGTLSSRRLEGHTDWIVDVAVAPEGERLATASRDRTVRLWDVATGAARSLEAGGEMTAVAFTGDGRAVVATSLDGTVRLWPDELPLDGPSLRAWIERRAVPATK